MANPTPTPGEYKRDVGSGDQQAYGEATAQNESLAAGDALEEQIAATSPAAAVQAPPPEPVYDQSPDPVYQPANEMDQVLYGDPEYVYANQKVSETPISRTVLRSLPLMASLANDPSTPPAIRAAYKAAVRALEREMNQH
jgi:hypothetical protein